MTSTLASLLRWGLAGAFVLATLYLVTVVYVSGQPLLALAVLAGGASALFVFSSPRMYAFRYVYPGLMAVLIFIVFPIAYTIWISFTNYSSTNILTFQRATEYLLADSYRAGDGSYRFSVHPVEAGHVLALTGGGGTFATAPLDLENPPSEPVPATATATEALPQALGLRDVVALRNALARVIVTLPDDTVLRMEGLRDFAIIKPRYEQLSDGRLRDLREDVILTPDHAIGFYVRPDGSTVTPGYRVEIGFDNYLRVFTDPAFREPFFKIFAWTVIFAALTVLFATALGMVLAVLLSWEALRFRAVYRVLLFLPYAVPGFISILVFKGLFNENFGEINYILNALFGIKPDWFSDPALARTMILIVNTWLGYPYIMVLCMGLLKAIPSDIHEAAVLAGVGPVKNFLKITFPLIIGPLTPLLIAAFAFNFNNFVLIELLTGGRPDFLGTRVPAGTTDILVTYTYRIAFEDSGKNFGLAAAISTVIFIMVAILAMVNLRLTRSRAQPA
jgi:maltose/maltodextrin transport system permease protein